LEGLTEPNPEPGLRKRKRPLPKKFERKGFED